MEVYGAGEACEVEFPELDATDTTATLNAGEIVPVSENVAATIS